MHACYYRYYFRFHHSRLIELSEHIEVLEAAIEFKNEAIASRELRASHILGTERTQSETLQRLQHMSASQARGLLASYVSKVVDLRLAAERGEKQRRRVAAECEEKQRTVLSLQRSLKQAQLEVERRLLGQEKVSEVFLLASSTDCSFLCCI